MTQPDTAAEPKPVRRRRKWRRRIVKLLVLCVVLLAVAPLALKLAPVRNWIAGKVSAKLGRKVEIEDASAYWFQGIDLEGVTVHSPVGFGKPLATVKHIHCDLDLFRMLRGKVGATVRVTEPHILFLKDAQGRSNADGLMADESAEGGSKEGGSKESTPRSASSGNSSDMRLTFQVINGRIEASDAGGPSRAIREIHVLYEQKPNQPATVDVTGRLEAMSTGGGDVEVRALSALQDGGGTFTVSLSEAVDLAKLAPIVEGAAGVKDLRGTLKLDVKGDLSSDGGLDGKGLIQGRGIAMALPSGLRTSVGDMNIDLTFVRAENGTTTQAKGTISQLTLEHPGNDTRAPVRVSEPTITLQAQALRSPDGNTWTVSEATLRAGQTASVDLQSPLKVTLGDAWHADGKVGLRVDLGRLRVLSGIVPSLQELQSGALSASLHAQTTPDGGARIAAGVRIESLAFAAGDMFARGYSEPRIDAQLRAERRADKRTSLEIVSFALSGVASKGTVGLSEGSKDVKITTNIDLAQSRLVAAFLALEPGASLAGTLVANTTISEANDRQRIQGDVVATAFTYMRPGAIPWHEPTMTIKHDVTLPSAAGRGTAHVLEANLGSLVAKASGSTWVSEPESDIDATLTLSGQAERLVDCLAMARGEGFQDLRATGALSGSINLTGPTDAAHLLINGDVQFGTWSSAGLNASDVRLSLRRTQPAAPLQVDVNAGLNGGTFAAKSALTLTQPKTMPWTLTLNAKGADTSNVLVSKGAGRYFSYLLPSLLPANADVPVMSGKLDVDVALEAQDISGDLMTHSLRGTSTIRMTQGEIRNSTLFGGSGGSPQMQQLLSVLSQVDPEIRRTIGTVGKALTFSSIDSSARVGNREVQVDRLELVGPYVRVSSSGKATFDQQVDMNTNVVLLGKSGERIKKLLPDSTIPLRMSGVMSNPQVTPRIDAKTLMKSGLVNEGKKVLEGLTGGTKGDGKKNPVDRLKDLFK